MKDRIEQMKEVIDNVCKFENPLTNMFACIIVGDLFMGNMLIKNK